jgi:hypothetical protein
MPGSVRLGNFTGPGGGPLPSGLRIRSLTGGMTYANTSTLGVPATPDAARGLQMANPYRPGATITAPSGPVAWWIHDVAGRVIASGTAGAGSGNATFTWDGRDRLGAAAASGVYLLDVRSLGGRDVRRFVLLGR